MTPHQQPNDQPNLIIAAPETEETQITVLPAPELPDALEYGDFLGRNTEEILVNRLGSGQDQAAKDMTRAYLRTLEHHILSRASSPLEVLLARRIVLCYATLQYFEALYLQTMDKKKEPRAHACELVRLNQAHERYMSAMKTLAQVRKAGALCGTLAQIGINNIYESSTTSWNPEAPAA